MLNIDVAVNNFWQFARFWKNGETAKFQMSCENGVLEMNLSSRLGHPDLLHFPPPPPPPPPSPPTPPAFIRKTPSQLRRKERRQIEKSKDIQIEESDQEEIEHKEVKHHEAHKNEIATKLNETLHPRTHLDVFSPQVLDRNRDQTFQRQLCK